MLYSVSRFFQTFMKKSARWTVKPVKEDKTYPHAYKLMKTVFELRLVGVKPLSAVLGLPDKDPRRISKTVAPVEAPEKEELIKNFRSRFQRK